MKIPFKILEKEWNQILLNIVKNFSVSSKEEIPKSLPCAIEYLTIKKLLTKELKPKLIVINGPAGAGKSTIGKVLEKLNFQRIPRLTDRLKRSEEIDGKDYYFISTTAFSALLNKNKILAGKTTYGFNRGFLKNNFKKFSFTIHSKKQYYTEGDSSLQAFKEAKNIFKLSSEDVLNIFILPPSFRELFKRLSLQEKNGNFTKEELKTRLKEGVYYLSKSIKHFKDFPNSLFVVNDDIGRVNSILSLFEIKNKAKQGENIIPFLNKEKKLQGLTTRDFAHQTGLIHPISVIYIFNSKGELLIQKRSNNGLWDHSAAGHLNLGENYQDAAKRELTEELGISDAPLSFLGSETMRHRLIPATMCHYFFLFSCIYNESLKLQKNEVLETNYLSLKELKQRLKKEPKMFSGGFHATIKYYSKLAKKLK